MPVMDGLEATRRIRAWEETHSPNSRQIIIGMSANSDGAVSSKKENVVLTTSSPSLSLPPHPPLSHHHLQCQHCINYYDCGICNVVFLIH